MAKRSNNNVRGRRNGSSNISRTVRALLEGSKEHKSTTSATSYTDTVAGTVNAISQQTIEGDSAGNRNGGMIFPKKLHVNLTLLSGVGSTNSIHRVMIFQDTLNTGTIPTVAQVLDGAVWNSTINVLPNQQKRFKVLSDKMFGVVGAADSAATTHIYNIPMTGQIFYNGATSAAASNGKNAIYIMTLTDSVTVSTAVVSFYANLIFTDA